MIKKLTKGQRTAIRIMDSAQLLFAVHGYGGTSLRDIASASNISEPALYRHFQDKDDLYNQYGADVVHEDGWRVEDNTGRFGSRISLDGDLYNFNGFTNERLAAAGVVSDRAVRVGRERDGER